jgi:hypothetical protein
MRTTKKMKTKSNLLRRAAHGAAPCGVVLGFGWKCVGVCMRIMQTCPTGEVRGSKRKGMLKPRSGFFGGTAAQRWGSQNP